MKEKLKKIWAYLLIYLDWGVWYLEKVKYFLALVGLNIVLNYPLWVMAVIGLTGFLFILVLGALHFHSHIPAVVEKITVKFMTYFTKRNFEVQEEILKTNKKIIKLLANLLNETKKSNKKD